MKLAVIIITYNSASCINTCISSVLENLPTDTELKLVVIDNNSSDHTKTELKQFEENKNVEIILNRENFGFAKSVNQGLNYAQDKFDPEFFFLLNPDAFMEKDSIRELINYAISDQSLGIISPLIIDSKTQRPWFNGGNIDWLRFRTKHDFSASEYLSGCAMLIKKNTLEKIGTFDESFFLYYEDADFCLRARKSGFGLGLAKNSICFHNESQSSSPQIKDLHLSKSAMIFFQKHYPRWALPYFWSMFWLRYYYHKLVSKKHSVANGLRDFRNSI